MLGSLNVSSTYIFSHDKGVGTAFAQALQNTGLVKSFDAAEHALPGFGEDSFNQHAPSILKPGFLRAMLGPFTTAIISAESSFSGRGEYWYSVQAGHWIENLSWTANRIRPFPAEVNSPLPDIDLSYLKDIAALKVRFYGTYRSTNLGGFVVF
ncbi:hypothetical protein F5Y19DRAFT_488951 [Xylariaceae sp. FL1651]|nr:hypothetical protein F5Y19DRAFT_488951 [Xylariaceae sp. FL1651]